MLDCSVVSIEAGGDAGQHAENVIDESNRLIEEISKGRRAATLLRSIVNVFEEGGERVGKGWGVEVVSTGIRLQKRSWWRSWWIEDGQSIVVTIANVVSTYRGSTSTVSRWTILMWLVTTCKRKGNTSSLLALVKT
jgi:hypothetical protein